MPPAHHQAHLAQLFCQALKRKPHAPLQGKYQLTGVSLWVLIEPASRLSPVWRTLGAVGQERKNRRTLIDGVRTFVWRDCLLDGIRVALSAEGGLQLLFENEHNFSCVNSFIDLKVIGHSCRSAVGSVIRDAQSAASR